MHNEIQVALIIAKAWLTSIPSRAIPYARWILNTLPHHKEAHAVLIEAHLKIGQRQSAQEIAEKIMPHLEHNEAARIALLFTQFNTKNTEQTAAELLLNAQHADLSTAVQNCELAITLRPNWFLPYYQLGKLIKNPVSLRKALSLAPISEFNYCFQALCEILPLEEVELLLDQYDESYGFQYIIEKAVVYLQKDPPEAFTYLSQAIPRTPIHDRFQILIFLFERTRKLTNANLVWKYLSSETPYWGSPLEQLAHYYLFHRKFELAEEILKWLAITHPTWEYHVQLGIVTNQEEYFLKGIELAPEQEPDAVTPYASFLHRQGRHTEAIDLLIPCVEANPQNKAAANLLLEVGRKACDSIL